MSQEKSNTASLNPIILDIGSLNVQDSKTVFDHKILKISLGKLGIQAKTQFKNGISQLKIRNYINSFERKGSDGTELERERWNDSWTWILHLHESNLGNYIYRKKRFDSICDHFQSF